MSLSFTEDQTAFRTSVRGVLARLASASGTRDFIEGRAPSTVQSWQRIDEALGLSALPIPEEYGGQGASWSEVGIVFEELGRTLFPTPYLSAMTATRLLTMCRTPAAEARLAAIAESTARPLVTFSGNQRTRFDATDTDPQVEVRVSGKSGLTPHHGDADAVIIEATLNERAVLVWIPVSEVQVEVVPTVDLTRPMCTVTANSAAGTILTETDVDAIVTDARAFIAMAVALESVGGADVCLTMTADYARDRVQFGSAIGSFQGVKHRLADLLRAYEPAKSAAYAALDAAGVPASREFEQVSSIAKLVADQMYAGVSIDSIQLHGAIGFTWEFDVHLHYKRAVANRALGASARDHRRAVKSMIEALLPARSDCEVSA
ncbi:alkylation response protein AidB-like acyl-CoA dehydrogenase [Antricoccus suffuscus]|uniref:Alkylation response protein AidB-like acyl-CoA dehydrogenase n=1 Tax=Antricoccus suffuscus TaxID=1629062 RepID=A0A2T1A6L1_9ACTN|nr:acyl-CoA dehydrogenase family protein [Antricoccus suffuscus]PRZ43968.1 alkylation response protein AidB-like acyl-CoA dehydrogenase [Antricoccus suffuscus]